MFSNLYSMWKDAWQSGKLPSDWPMADSFLTWATKNGYKVEYGYEGDFTPENCLAAIPDISGTVSGNLDADTLTKMKIAELKQLAADLGLDVGAVSTKQEIAEIIASKGQRAPSEASGGS